VESLAIGIAVKDGQGKSPGSMGETRWTWVRLAADPDCREALLYLDSILRQYLAPLRMHLRSKFGMSEQDAEDLVQGFVERCILLGKLLEKADPKVGKFRTLLLCSLDHFVADERSKQQAAKRYPPGGIVPLDSVVGIAEVSVSDATSIEFDRAWARSVLRQASEKTRVFYQTRGRPQLWSLFEEAALSSQAGRASLDELARKHGFETPRQASNALITVRRKFGSTLREVVRAYTARQDGSDPERCVDEELHDLIAIVAEEDSPDTRNGLSDRSAALPMP
jgi:DNA-directed RNA polymerase specialized sigma24 family protein